MQLLRNKTKTATVALFLMLTIAAMLFSLALPVANAHYPPWKIPTVTYCSVSPQTIGVGEEAIIIYWSRYVPPTADNIGYGQMWDFMINVTKPDGRVERFGPRKSDAVGSGWMNYVPDQAGTYKIVATMLECKITGLPFPPGMTKPLSNPESINDTYLSSTSDPAYLTVQQEAIQRWPEAPLPTQYWTRPINSMNRDWWQVAANWLAGAAQTNGPTTNFAYGPGPESAHILWATPLWDGGVADARFGSAQAMWMGREYESFGLEPPVIINGKIYYNNLVPTRIGVRCLDLYTGKEITANYRNTTTSAGYDTRGGLGPFTFDVTGRIAFGQLWNYHSMNVHGVYEYLWETSTGVPGKWNAYDPYTNRWVFSIANVTQTTSRPGNPSIRTGATGTNVYGNDGSILYYNIVNYGNTTNPKHYLQVWNTSRVLLWFGGSPTDTIFGMQGKINKIHDGRHGFSLNVSIPKVQGSILAVREGEYVIGGTKGGADYTLSYPPGSVRTTGNLWALNLDRSKGSVGTLLWNITYEPPPRSENLSPPGTSGGGGLSLVLVDPEDDVFSFTDTVLRVRYTYSLATGKPLWQSAPENPWQFYGMSTAVYQGKLFSYGYGGQLIAYNIKTGKIVWTYNCTGIGRESPYGNYPISSLYVADGKLYIHSTEHSPTQPFWRGSYLRCINASNGVELWKAEHWGEGPAAIADGLLVRLNSYDNRIYCYGKGPSATTVSASPSIIANGSSVLIRGTVLDQSPAAKDTPAIADADQELWMAYLYAQQSCPTTAKGVLVFLQAMRSDGTVIDIMHVTTDLKGQFEYSWTPPTTDTYKILATFEGSKSYWSSYAETAIGVSAAPTQMAPAEPVEIPAYPDYTPLFVGIAAIGIVAIVLVIYTLYTVRKLRK